MKKKNLWCDSGEAIFVDKLEFKGVFILYAFIVKRIATQKRKEKHGKKFRFEIFNSIAKFSQILYKH